MHPKQVLICGGSTLPWHPQLPGAVISHPAELRRLLPDCSDQGRERLAWLASVLISLLQATKKCTFVTLPILPAKHKECEALQWGILLLRVVLHFWQVGACEPGLCCGFSPLLQQQFLCCVRVPAGNTSLMSPNSLSPVSH